MNPLRGFCTGEPVKKMINAVVVFSKSNSLLLKPLLKEPKKDSSTEKWLHVMGSAECMMEIIII